MKKPATDEPSFGSLPFGRASPYLSGGVFLFVVCFIASFDRLASAFALDVGDLQTGILFPSLAGALIGFTATWDKSERQKRLGVVFCMLNCIVFLGYGALFMLYAYGSK
jgi:hypothetical protein